MISKVHTHTCQLPFLKTLVRCWIMIKHHYFFKLLELSIANYFLLQDLCLQIVTRCSISLRTWFFYNESPRHKNSWSLFFKPCCLVSNCHNLIIQRLSLAFIQKYHVYCPKPILSTLSNPTYWNSNSALATEFTLPTEDIKEAFTINGGNIESWEESLQRRGYYPYWASRSGSVWGWPYL